jgi:hypothetical protein
VLSGLLLPRGRRTVSSWLRAAHLQADYIDYYYFNSSMGRKSAILARYSRGRELIMGVGVVLVGGLILVDAGYDRPLVPVGSHRIQFHATRGRQHVRLVHRERSETALP